MSPQPSPARTVLALHGGEAMPAVITRVLSEQPEPDGSWLVNLSVIPDGYTSLRPLAMVALFDTEDAARAHPHTAAFWPPRVG